jgi:hypothetical protein
MCKHQIENVRSGKNQLSVSLWSQPVFKQKVGYIDAKPLAAGSKIGREGH